MGTAYTSAWGRVDEDGTVLVRTADGERPVGTWHAGSPEAGLAYYERRYDELVTEIGLLEKRLASAAAEPKATRERAARLREGLAAASVVGDLEALDRRLEALLAACKARLAAAAEQRAAAAAAATDAKRSLAEEAERLATTTDWKGAGERFRAMVASWREIRGVDRRTDQELWERVSAARAQFTKRRSAHFAALDEQRTSAAARKEALVAEAESLAGSSDWGPTAGRLKALMGEWKSVGRGPKDVEDALWQRFRAAQDAFFSRRSATFAERDAAARAHAAAKEALLAEAETAAGSADVDVAQRRLREIQERWDAVGRAPREVEAGLERRLAAIAERIRTAAEARWRRPSPSSSPLVERLRESVTKLEGRAARARAQGRIAEAEEAEATLATQREWLSQAERAGR